MLNHEWFAHFFRNLLTSRDPQRKKKEFQSIRQEFAASLGVMRLEARRVLNAAALPTGPGPPPPPAAAGNVAAAAQSQQNTVVLTVDAAQAAQKQSADIFVVKRVGANVDVTLICERPKITPHAPAMIARLAELLGCDRDRVSVKATTTERLGFTGRMEGIAAQAVATVLLPA